MPGTMCSVHCRRPAMATLFEAWLVGDDEEHLAAVGEAVLDEVERIEQVLSRFDRGSELYRVNRQAAQSPVRVSYELFEVLQDCLHHGDKTDGFFDVTATTSLSLAISRPDRFQLNSSRRTISFADPSLQLDLGGYGKGYALDAAAAILSRFGVESFLLHGGTSSILARGMSADGGPWLVALGDPFEPERSELENFPLVNAGLSTSAAWDARQATADIVDPLAQRVVAAEEAYCVVAPTAKEAEVISTALTAMGRVRADDYLARHPQYADERYQVLAVRRAPGGSHVCRLGAASSAEARR